MTSKPGFVSALLAVAILLELAAVRLLFAADRERVTLAGAPFGAACAFRQRFGVPCPACGLTRSVVLTLHGRVAAAADLNPGGPAGVFGLLYFSGAMLWLSYRQRRRPARSVVAGKRRICMSTAGVGAALVTVVLAHWIWELWTL